MKRSEKYIRVLYFPIYILYLEVVIHLCMNLDMKYIGLYGLYAIAIGLLLSFVTARMRKKGLQIFVGILSIFLSLIYCGEVMCKDILQQFYPIFSAVEVAAGNHLGDYWHAMVQSIFNRWYIYLLLLFVPLCIYYVLFWRIGKWKNRVRIRYTVFIAISSAMLYGILLAIIFYVPWKGEFTPKNMYRSDTNINEQIEQFGILPMILLDGKHALFGVTHTDDGDVESLLSDEQLDEEDAKVETIDPVDTSPNVMDIDFEHVASSSSNKNIKWLSKYFQSVRPTKKNEYTGMFEGYNVIFLTAEGFSGYMIDEKLTPTLYRLTHEGFFFKNFYSALHFTSTSAGEFQNLTGLYPKNGFPISMTETGKRSTNLYFTLANQLKKKGYLATGYHFNENMYGRHRSHPNLGYNWRQANKCKEPIVKEKKDNGEVYWPQSDKYMIEKTVSDYVNSTVPFHVYYLTLSGHLPYGNGSNAMSLRNKDLVKDLPYKEKTKAYIAANLELEKGLTALIDSLEKANVADRTLIVMAPDHIPYGDVDVLEDLAGKSFGGGNLENIDEHAIDFDVYRNALMIWSPSMKDMMKEQVAVEKVCCQVDILPTLLNLLGLEYDSRLFAGSDILSDAEGMVVFSSKCWLTDQGFYNRFTEKFTKSLHSTLEDGKEKQYVESRKKMASYKLKITPMIIESNYYNVLFGEN